MAREAKRVRILVSRGLVGATARCDECDWLHDGGELRRCVSRVQAGATRHARATGHAVHVVVERSATYRATPFRLAELAKRRDQTEVTGG